MAARLVDHFLMIELNYGLNICANSLQSPPPPNNSQWDANINSMPCCDATHNHVVNSVLLNMNILIRLKVDNHKLPHERDTHNIQFE